LSETYVLSLNLSLSKTQNTAECVRKNEIDRQKFVIDREKCYVITISISQKPCPVVKNVTALKEMPLERPTN
jgi:hypothetical protein